MKKKLLDFLACPTCGGDILMPYASKYEGNEIIEALLSCRKCLREYKVERGVPRFVDISKIEEEKAQTARNFGWERNKFDQVDEKYEEQLLGWLQPVKPSFFEGKVVLEGGCGKGRHTLIAAKWGAKEVVAVDLSDAVEVAFEKTRHLPNAHIIQADIFKLPLKRKFDYAFSIGVLHHTPSPKDAFISLASRVKENGAISAWVYGAENNEWITKYVNPIREKITSKMNLELLYHLSKIPTFFLFVGSKLIYRPLSNTAFGKKLFYRDYIVYISEFGWREQHRVVFDHLTAPIAAYIPLQEFESWWKAIKAKDVQITWHNKNSWCGFGRV
jgi:SAM-dependent methyltransferase